MGNGGLRHHFLDGYMFLAGWLSVEDLTARTLHWLFELRIYKMQKHTFYISLEDSSQIDAGISSGTVDAKIP